jgi:hypothetical protein
VLLWWKKLGLNYVGKLTFASTGTPAFAVHPGEAGHGDLGMIEQNDIAICISFFFVFIYFIFLFNSDFSWLYSATSYLNKA